ncbi:MAG: hypothetical protein E4H27_05270 [Anaerolineales bacterium]|nr:MAG: hypothetical protein E4H27_05270 [Anaerolineales bacterium]
MIEIVWQFVIKEGARGQFELAYGPGGVYSRLFERCPGFRGTTVLRGTKNPQDYLTVDMWDTQAEWEQARVEHETEYADLETTLAAWIASRAELGSFTVLAQATVRPRSKAGRSKSGETQRSNRRSTR